MDPTPLSTQTAGSFNCWRLIMGTDILGIDLAKRVFQFHGADRRGQVVHRSKVSRGAVPETVAALAPRVIAMEACSSAHHWGRRFEAMGIEVRLISPQYVTPFVKTNENDYNDAEAIVEAACRPTMRFVPVKSVGQQHIQAAHRVRELFVHQRTALINQVRGLLGERGLTIARSPQANGRYLLCSHRLRPSSPGFANRCCWNLSSRSTCSRDVS